MRLIPQDLIVAFLLLGASLFGLTCALTLIERIELPQGGLGLGAGANEFKINYRGEGIGVGAADLLDYESPAVRVTAFWKAPEGGAGVPAGVENRTIATGLFQFNSLNQLISGEGTIWRAGSDSASQSSFSLQGPNPIRLYLGSPNSPGARPLLAEGPIYLPKLSDGLRQPHWPAVVSSRLPAELLAIVKNLEVLKSRERL